MFVPLTQDTLVSYDVPMPEMLGSAPIITTRGIIHRQNATACS